MPIRERIHGFLNQRAVDEMAHLAGVELDRGGSLNVEVGEGAKRRYLNITKENMQETMPKLLEILKEPRETRESIKFTILDREHQKTDGFTAEVKSRKLP
jgi:hypothetical protein